MTAKKTPPPALELPPRPPSKVEVGLAAAEAEKPSAPELTEQAKRERAIEAMVALGLTAEQANTALDLAAENPAVTAEAGGEADAPRLDYGAPLCEHGCHGQSWGDVRADLNAVSCEHGSFPRKPDKTDK